MTENREMLEQKLRSKNTELADFEEFNSVIKSFNQKYEEALQELKKAYEGESIDKFIREQRSNCNEECKNILSSAKSDKELLEKEISNLKNQIENLDMEEEKDGES